MRTTARTTARSATRSTAGSAAACLIGVGMLAANLAAAPAASAAQAAQAAQAAPAAPAASGAGAADRLRAGDRTPVRTTEKGYVLFCTGRSGDVSVVLDLYQNSAFGTHASLSVETPDGEYGGGYGPEETAVFDRGAVSASVPVRRLDGSGEPAGSATVAGTYEEAGRPERVREVIEDPAGRFVITRGTNTPLDATASVEVLGRTVPLTCPTAFAFDLTVLRINTTGG
ncbi:hypothetical protein [Streptomyces sp. HB2AG]|uniref:hypothetical protein n=1 Tax=Streptomyces sp. HB2AG TaxID=2983400 RepID=UPI0022AA3528|nr:hypothetical protein [Streptomyces sp. HB2AG]MCZ2525028.1 hypothetical protein [Streptomyces sp. HB2AG]